MDVDRFLASPNALRATRRLTTTSDARRTTTFSDFLSDSDGDDDDGDDLARMQQQADDMTYIDNSFGAGSPDDALDLRGVHGVDDGDDDSFLRPAAPKPAPKPATSLRASASVRASTTFGRATMLRRLTSGRRKSKAAKVDKADIESVMLGRSTSGGSGRKTLLQRMTIGRKNKTNGVAVDSSGGVLMDSDESDESSDGAEQNRLSDFSEHDSSFASNDHSFRLDPDQEPNFVDHSFSDAMRGRGDDLHDDDDDHNIYDNGSSYDDEVEEIGIREKAAHVRETEQEESGGASFSQRLSEEPYHEPPPDENPCTASSFDSVSSSGGNFFVESVRGSSDSIAPVMELSASPASVSMSSRKGSISSSPASSYSAKGSLSSSPAAMLARNSADLSFRTSTSFVPVSLMSPAPPPPPSQAPVASLGFRVVDHTQAPTPSVTAPVSAPRSTLTRALDPRHSISSSSSSSGDELDDVSFSSNIDDSFSGERPRASSEDNLSLVFQQHVDSGNSQGPVAKPEKASSFLQNTQQNEKPASPRQDVGHSFLVQKHHTSEEPPLKDAGNSFLVQKHLSNAEPSPRDADLSFLVQKHLQHEEVSPKDADLSFLVRKHLPSEQGSPKEPDDLSFVVNKHLQSEEQLDTSFVVEKKLSIEQPASPKENDELSFFGLEHLVNNEQSLKDVASRKSSNVEDTIPPTQHEDLFAFDARATVVKVDPRIQQEKPSFVKSSSRPIEIVSLPAAAEVASAKPVERPAAIENPQPQAVPKPVNTPAVVAKPLLPTPGPVPMTPAVSAPAQDIPVYKPLAPVVTVIPIKANKLPAATPAPAPVASVSTADAVNVVQAEKPLAPSPTPVPSTNAAEVVISAQVNKLPAPAPAPAPVPSTNNTDDVIPVKVKMPPAPAPALAPAEKASVNGVEAATRKTTKFSKPLPPGRRRGPPAAVTSVAAVSASVVAATPALVGATASSVSPPKSQSVIDVSIASSRPSDARLDFTGVFLGEPEGTVAKPPVKQQTSPLKVPEQQSVAAETESEISFDDSALAASNAGPPSVRRMVSAQEVSERKVEAFFRKTYTQNDDDDMSDFMHLTASTRGRSKTAANRAMAGAEVSGSRRVDPMLSSTRSRRSSTSAMKMVDLKSLRSGQRIEELLRANEEETKDDDDEDYPDRQTAVRKRTLSRPSARLPIKEDLLEVFPSRPSTASPAALARRQPPPPRPNEEPLTPSTVYSVTSGSDASSSIADSEIARPNPMLSSKVIQRNFTLSLASGTVGRSSFSVSDRSSPNEIPMPPNYMLSPRRNDKHRPSSSLGSFSSSSTDEAPTTPQLPVLSVTTRAVVPPTSLAASAASNKLASSGVASSPFSASGMNNNVAPGFRWHPELSQQNHAPGTKQSHESAWSSEDGSLSTKESVWHAAGALSIGGGRPSTTPSVANHFQRVSATLKSSFQRVRSQFRPPNRGNYDLTSPKSICSAPPRLPRGYDDRQFYSRLGNIQCGDAMIVVNKAGRGNSAKEQAIQHKRKTQAWLLFLGALLGIVVGIGLSHIDSLSSKFKPVVDIETGEMTLPTGTKWLLLPGSLFLRMWNCLTLPLLFCHVVNGIAELVMSQNATNAISLRTVGYLVVTAALTTTEGVGLALVYHAMGLFTRRQASLAATATSVKSSVNVIDRVKGMTAMMCSAGGSYLQVSQNGQRWRCSNETIPLPVADGIKVAGTEWNGTSAAVFAFTQPATLSLKPPGSVIASSSYYPAVTASVGDLVTELLATLSPSNLVDSFSKSLASSVVVVAVAFGLVVGVRAFHRSITAQQHLKQSQTQHATHMTVLAESILAKPHPVLGVMVEFQQLLEWIVGAVQGLAPIGVASLLAGHIVLHRDEWFDVPGPAISLILGVTLTSVIHVLVISPVLIKLLTGMNAWSTLSSFLPAMCLSFGTGNVVLAVPVLAQNFASAQIVTKSMAQVAAGVGAAVLRSGHALFFPLAMLFLLETTVPDGAVPFTPTAVLGLAGFTFLSCFLAVGPGPKLGLPGVTASASLQLVLLLFKAWIKQKLSGAATMHLLVVADVLLSRVAAAVSTHDHVFFARLLGDHCAELCLAPADDALGVGASPVYL